MTNHITLGGNLVAEPELRFTPNGVAVARLRMAVNEKDKDGNDKDSLFIDVSVWRQQAENVAESLTRGMRVLVTGKLKSRQYETSAGEKRTAYEVDAWTVAPDLAFATARVTKTQAGSNSSSYSSNAGSHTTAAKPAAPQFDEPPF